MAHTRPARSVFTDFLRSQSAGAAVLMAAAALALVIANSPMGPGYFALLHTPVLGIDVLHWTNDGLMAIFFLLVGLEIKRELLEGQLSTWPSRVLPGVAALGGMIIPAIVYALINRSDPAALRGWAVPAATDIAFALGVLALLGSRVPTSLKVFLTALAILDDLGAVVIIALFYTSDLSLPALGGALGCLLVLVAMNRLRLNRLWAYLAVGAVMWAFMLRSGVHPTVAGVLLAFIIPLKPAAGAHEAAASPLHRLEHGLGPWVGFLVVPVFGLANAGVALSGLSANDLTRPVPLGIAAGLLVGKQAGVFGAAWLAVRMRWAPLPHGAGWRELYGTALLCGIGFTMSLFIALLAFPSAELEQSAKLGILAGSAISGLAGAALLGLSPKRRARLPL
jgi:NhaA family Na+:H+ antiporter